MDEKTVNYDQKQYNAIKAEVGNYLHKDVGYAMDKI